MALSISSGKEYPIWGSGFTAQGVPHAGPPHLEVEDAIKDRIRMTALVDMLFYGRIYKLMQVASYGKVALDDSFGYFGPAAAIPSETHRSVRPRT